MRQLFRAVLAIFAATTLISVACTGDGPTNPDGSVVTPPPVNTQPSAPTPSPTPVVGNSGAVTATFNYSLPSGGRVTFVNDGTETQKVHLASYCVTQEGDRVDSQYRRGAVTADVKNDRKPVVLDVGGCTCRTQYDAGLGDPFPEGVPPFYQELLAYAFAGSDLCTRPSPSPTPNPTCANYTPPIITGDIASDVQSTRVVFSQGSVAPSGGSFSPTLPQTVTRPDADQPAEIFSTTYTLPYGPSALRCSVNKAFTKPVPPKDPPQGTCNMRITKFRDRATAVPGDEIIYRIEIKNIGGANCTGGGVKIEDNIPDNIQYKRERHASNGTFTGNQGDTLVWNFDVMIPDEESWVEWDGKITNPQGNCNDFTVRNKAKVWSQQQGDVNSNEVSTSVDVTCQTCQPTHLNQQDGCYKPNPWGNGNNPDDICEYFNLVPTYKDESGSGDSYQFTRSAVMVVVHWGGASCSVNGAQSYTFTENAVSGGTVINPAGNPGQGGFSFAQYCSCPHQD